MTSMSPHTVPIFQSCFTQFLTNILPKIVFIWDIVLSSLPWHLPCLISIHPSGLLLLCFQYWIVLRLGSRSFTLLTLDCLPWQFHPFFGFHSLLFAEDSQVFIFTPNLSSKLQPYVSTFWLNISLGYISQLELMPSPLLITSSSWVSSFSEWHHYSSCYASQIGVSFLTLPSLFHSTPHLSPCPVHV